MKEILLCKYGEVALKGLNKSYFENLMFREIKERLSKYGEISVSAAQSTIVITPESENFDIAAAEEELCRVFGLAAVSRAAVVEKDIEAIKAVAREYIPPYLAGAATFKAESKRSDKRFPLTSPQISAEVGGAVQEVMPHLKVDVRTPAAVVNVEVRDDAAYIHCGQRQGAGGMPSGSGGRALLLLSGGIDSPVAGYMMAKRGVTVEALHFESFPYTSERALEKVMSLARLVCAYTRTMTVNVISLTKIQEALRAACAEEYFTLLLRRSMMRLSARVAAQTDCRALITGESLGQVASQTMDALSVTDAAAGMPVFRPLIGMDKGEIVGISRKINTYETSILPYEDCCTIFTPRRPKTRPELGNVLVQEALVDLPALEEEAFDNRNQRIVYGAGESERQSPV